MTVDKLGKALCFLVIAIAPLASQTAFAQTPTVKVSVMQGGTTASYSAPWYPGMSVINALEQALPADQEGHSLSLNYLPAYAGYVVAAVGGVHNEGVTNYWSFCLLPAGSGSTMVRVPLLPNKVLVGSGDTVILAYKTAGTFQGTRTDDNGCPVLSQN
jgi:hypothetical protein